MKRLQADEGLRRARGRLARATVWIVCVWVALVSACSGSPDGVGGDDGRAVSGRLLDLSGCDGDAACTPRSVAKTPLCAHSGAELGCTSTDDDGRFVIEDLETLSLDFATTAPVPGRTIVATVGRSGTDVRGSITRDIDVQTDSVTLQLGEDYEPADIDLSSTRVSVRRAPYAGGDADRPLTMTVDVVDSVSLEAATSSIVLKLTRLPIEGESWVIDALESTTCEGCEPRRVELGRLTSLLDEIDRSALPRADASKALPPGVFNLIPKAPMAAEQAILDKYIETGGIFGPLGWPFSGVLDTASGGAIQHFQFGAILWSSATGAHEVHGSIFERYNAWGLEAGPLGYPLTDELTTADGVGRFSFFELGAIYWTPATGAHVIFGDILLEWAALGFEAGLGYPTTDSVIAPDGIGVFNHFQNGVIYWTEFTGAHEVHGAILEKWAATGWELGPLSYPTTNEQGTADGVGRFNRFLFGSIYWTPSFGAHEVHGAIHDKYASLGFERSVLGYPTTDELTKQDGVGKFNRFQSGSIYWTPSLGAHEVHGAIHAKYLGWEEGFLGYPTTDEFDGGNGFRVSRFQNGQMNFKLHAPGLKVYTQNMAMMESPPGYKGVDKIAALDTLKAFLKSQQPDIVGLQEMFDDEARSHLIADSTIANMYPFRSSGPEDGDIVEQDGGLMLLSRFPIVERDQIVYRVCADEDCLANKGALYAKIEVAPGVTYDVFLSHLQNANSGSFPFPDDGSERPTVQAQLGLLYSFVEAKRGSQQTPAIVMGDLNTNGNNPTQYDDMIARLHDPIDVWTTTHPGELGITSDNRKNFHPEETSVPLSERGKTGSRLDYVFLYDGARFQANLVDAKVIMTMMRGDKDISDHYGVMAFLHSTQELDTVYTGTISRVEAKLQRFHCFEVTDGTVSVGSDDEVDWRMMLSDDGGPTSTTRARRVNGINEDTNFFFSPPPRLVSSAVSTSITVEVEGQEIDESCVGICVVTGRASLGRKSLTFTKEQLFESLQRPIPYGTAMMRGDDGEYMATVELRAFR